MYGKYCKNCGTECKSDAKFCNNCGNPLILQAQRMSEKREKKGNRGMWIVLAVIGVAAVALVVAGMISARQYNSPQRKLSRALQNGDYEAAISIYEENFYGTDNAEFEAALTEWLGEIKEDYLSGNITYEETVQKIGMLQSTKMREVCTYAEEVLEYVESLDASRNAYQLAEELYEEGDYAAAIKQYKLVIEDDPCYEEAQTKLSAAEDAYRTDILRQAEEMADAGSYGMAVNIIENALDNLEADVRLTEQLVIYMSDNEDQACTNYVQGLLDVRYKAEYTTTYGKLADATEKETQDMYKSVIKYLVEGMYAYYKIDTDCLTNELKDGYWDLAVQLY